MTVTFLVFVADSYQSMITNNLYFYNDDKCSFITLSLTTGYSGKKSRWNALKSCESRNAIAE